MADLDKEKTAMASKGECLYDDPVSSAATPPEIHVPELYCGKDLEDVSSQQDEDNLSLEVNFGELNSCHASDVSSLSFQNAVLEQDDTSVSERDLGEGLKLTKQGSGDSTDSAPGEFPEEAVTFCSLEEELEKKVQVNDIAVGGLSSANTGEEESTSVDSFCTSESGGTLKRKSKMKSDVKDDEFESIDSATFDQQQQLFHQSIMLKTGVGSSGSLSSGIVVSSGDICRTVCDGSSQSSIDRCSPIVNKCVVTAVEQSVHKDNAMSTVRNTLEIRNNIPNVNEVRQTSNHHEATAEILNVVPRTHKKSPGLAQRLVDDSMHSLHSMNTRSLPSSTLDTSVISAQESFEAKLKINGGMSHNTNTYNNANLTLADTNKPNLHAPKYISGTIGITDSAQDVENEYDYVKYSRVQSQGAHVYQGQQGIVSSHGSHSGDMYVGMRLAYSDSSDSLNCRQNTEDPNLHNDQQIKVQYQEPTHYLQQSSPDSSPEKSNMQYQAVQRNLKNSDLQLSKVNEDTLTEIPLNGNHYLNSNHRQNVIMAKDGLHILSSEKAEFSLSPEATECDSAEVESVISEEGGSKSSMSGMPAVEDGLSSTQSSDIEDDLPDSHDLLKQLGLPSTPAVLPVENQQHVEVNGKSAPMITGGMTSQIGGSMQSGQRTNSTASLSSSSAYSEDTSQFRKEAVDMAIRDIRAAIQRSKHMAVRTQHHDVARSRVLQRPNSADIEQGANEEILDSEPVWVMR